MALYAEDLPQAYRYVQIGETLRNAGRAGEAIAWLRRGLTEAVSLLKEIRDLHRRAGMDFTGYLADLTERYRRKTTLLAELARAGL